MEHNNNFLYEPTLDPELLKTQSEIPISQNELELFRIFKKRSILLDMKFDKDPISAKKKFSNTVEKIMKTVQKSLAVNDEASADSPIYQKKPSLSIHKTSLINVLETAKSPEQQEKLPECCTGLPDLVISEKQKAAENMLALLKLREKYMFKCHRDYKDVEGLIKKIEGSSEPIINYRTEIPMMPKLENAMFSVSEEGVYEAHVDEKLVGDRTLSALEFLNDLSEMITHIHKSINKSLAHQRLQILDEKFKMHKLHNSEKEHYETQEILHRDFYNCRKVDTHIHFAACMRAKQLLRFIVEKIEKDGDKPVIFDKKEKRMMTLREVCDAINVNSKDINLDSLNVQADSSIFERFDRFNNKYNPVGKADLRTIFLKTDNDIQGVYLAELTRLIMQEMEEEKYCFAEFRVSIYGKSMQEWHKLAEWFKIHSIFSHQVRWMIQIPRLYSVYKKNNIINNFQEMIDNIFRPIFEVTIDPSKDPALYALLFQIVGFDTVDDESVYEVLHLKHLALRPSQWNEEENPIYAYWIYYIYANLYSLNSLRALRGLNTFSFRPHCGESGNVDHLATGFLVADGINHGIRLDHNPVLQYLYYLEQIGIAVSPLSNNKLFLQYQRNPFPKFFSRGLNVSLSTDDPLMIHITREPLLEEYAVATQVWNFATVDLCEIARNSVRQSSFEEVLKRHWLGQKYDSKGIEANEPKLTNVPNSRFGYRINTLNEELTFLKELSEVKVASGDY